MTRSGPWHGNFTQVDWDLRFLSALRGHLSVRPWDAGVYEIERLAWADSVMTLVVRVWGRDRSGLVGWREHLPAVRSGFGPDDPETAAGAWHVGEFYPCYLPEPLSPMRPVFIGSAEVDHLIPTILVPGGRNQRRHAQEGDPAT